METVNITEIIEPETDLELIEENAFIRICADGSKSTGRVSMLTEITVSIRVNGIEAGSVPCTPQLVTELVIGWLNAEGYIDFISEVSRIEVSRDGMSVDVTLADGSSYSPTDINKLQACTCGSSNAEPKNSIKPVVPIEWKKEWIFSLVEDFENILPLRKLTMAAHNCRLARGEEILFRCEDIGRHSAIDKVIGWAMRNGVDMRDCVLFTSGRISRAMVQKAIRAGIPVMAGKGTISKKAVQLAREHDLTLIGYSKKDSISIFTQP